MSLAASVAALAGLLVWQLADPPSLGRPTIARDVQTLLADELQADPDLDYVGADVRFTTARAGQDDLLLATVYVRPTNSGIPVEEALRGRLQDLIEAKDYEVVPLVDVTVLVPPD